MRFLRELKVFILGLLYYFMFRENNGAVKLEIKVGKIKRKTEKDYNLIKKQCKIRENQNNINI